MNNRPAIVKLKSVRTLVRYVDKQRAVIEACFALTDKKGFNAQPVEVHFRLTGPSGKQYTCQSPVELVEGVGRIRFEITDPRRWWPAGMGAQDLYELRMTLLVGDKSIDNWTSTVGMTSVRSPQDVAASMLLVNGQQYDIQSVVAIGRADENSVLPVSGDMLLLVRDYFGPDQLYDAADRAGILLVQSVPLLHENEPDVTVRLEVDRLSAHPSLAGWLVDSAGRAADRIVTRIAQLDPTHNIFRNLPMAS